MNAGELHVYPDATAVASALAELFVEIGATAQAERGVFSVSLAGGNTPRTAYALLPQPRYRSALSWSDVYVYFGDERCVPPDDEQSNYRMASETFLGGVPIPPKNVHRIRGEIEPKQAAAQYARELTDDLGSPPVIDMVMLGMGPDGHTASLFPGADPLTDTDRLVRAVYAEAVGMERVTLTPAVLNAARNVVFTVEGRSKAAALAEVREGDYDPSTYPAQIVSPKGGRLIWLADVLAVGALKNR